MTFEQLEIFISVVENGGFTKAAEALYISHSTTSRNVAALEESLGVRLLERDSRSIRMTPAGELLYREGKELVERAERLGDELRQLSASPSGSLNAVSVDMTSPAVSELFKSFCEQYPQITLGIRHRELSEVSSQISSGRADIGLSFSYALPNNNDEYETRSVEASSFCAVVPLDHPLACRKTAKISELRSSPYVSVGAQRSRFTKRLEEAILRDRPSGEILSVSSLESLFLQVRSGRGISVVPQPIAQRYAEGCVLLGIEDEDTAFDVVAFWKRDNDSQALLLFSNFLDGKDGEAPQTEI